MRHYLTLSAFLLALAFSASAQFTLVPQTNAEYVARRDAEWASDRGDLTLLHAVHTAFDALSEIEQGLTPDPCPQRRERRVRRSTLPAETTVVPVSEISFEYANDLFQEFVQDNHLPFAYPEDGCYARSRYMAQQMNRHGITAGQVYVEGRLRVQSDVAARGMVYWRYHVAPVVMVRRNGETKPYVIDPSLFSEPVPVERWMHYQTDNPVSRIDSWYYTSQHQYLPRFDGGVDASSYSREENNRMKQTLNNYLEISNQRRASTRPVDTRRAR